MLPDVHTPLGHSHSISLLPLAVLGQSSRLTWHDFAYVTMAQKVPSSTLLYCLYCYHSFFWPLHARRPRPPVETPGLDARITLGPILSKVMTSGTRIPDLGLLLLGLVLV